MAETYTEVRVFIVVDATKVLQENYSDDGVSSNVTESIGAIDEYIETHILSKATVSLTSISTRRRDLKRKHEFGKKKRIGMAFCRRKWFRGRSFGVKIFGQNMRAPKMPHLVKRNKKRKYSSKHEIRKTVNVANKNTENNDYYNKPIKEQKFKREHKTSAHVKSEKQEGVFGDGIMNSIVKKTELIANQVFVTRVRTGIAVKERIQNKEIERCESVETTSDYDGSSSGFFSDDEMEFDDDWERTRFSKFSISRHRKSRQSASSAMSPIKTTSDRDSINHDFSFSESGQNFQDFTTISTMHNKRMDIETTCFDVMSSILNQIDSHESYDTKGKENIINLCNPRFSLTCKNAMCDLSRVNQCNNAFIQDNKVLLHGKDNVTEKHNSKRCKSSPTRRLKSTVTKVQCGDSNDLVAMNTVKLNKDTIKLMSKNKSKQNKEVVNNNGEYTKNVNKVSPQISDNELEPGEIVDDPEPPTDKNEEHHRYSHFSRGRYTSRSPRSSRGYFSNLRSYRSRPYSPRYRGTARGHWPYTSCFLTKPRSRPVRSTYNWQDYTTYRIESRESSDLRGRLDSHETVKESNFGKFTTSFRGQRFRGRGSSEYSRKPHESVSEYIRQYRMNEKGHERSRREISRSRSPPRKRRNRSNSKDIKGTSKRCNTRSKSDDRGKNRHKRIESQNSKDRNNRHRHDLRKSHSLEEECDISKNYENFRITRTFTNNEEKSSSDILFKEAQDLVKLVDTINKVIPLESLIKEISQKKSPRRISDADGDMEDILPLETLMKERNQKNSSRDSPDKRSYSGNTDLLHDQQRDKSPDILELAYEKLSNKRKKIHKRKKSDPDEKTDNEHQVENQFTVEPEIDNIVVASFSGTTTGMIPASFVHDGIMKFETDSHMKCFESVREVAFKKAIRHSDANYEKYSKRKFLFEDELIQQLERNYDRYLKADREITNRTMPRFASADLMTESIAATWRDPHMVSANDRQLREFDDVIGYVGFNIPCYWCELVFAEGKFLRAFPVLDPIGCRDDTMYCQTQHDANDSSDNISE